MKRLHRVSVTAPPTVSNLGPGFDVLGCAVDGPADNVVAQVRADSGVFIADPGHPELPGEAARHASGIAAIEVLRRAGITDLGVELRVTKRIPLSGGQGGSAASAVAAAVAVNTLLGSPLDDLDLLRAALVAEEAVAGRHADNLAPALLGGLILVRSLDPLDVIRLPVPAELRLVIAHPEQRMNTREAREAIPRDFSRETLVHQMAQLGALVAGLVLSDYELIGRAFEDRVAEPFRAPLLPGFPEAREAALRCGALGASISGSGPTTFALVRGESVAQDVARSMQAAYRSRSIECSARVASIRPGAQVEEAE